MHVGVAIMAALVAMSCARRPPLSYVPLAPAAMPAASFEKPPEQPYEPSSPVIVPSQMTSFYDVPGEYGYILNGGTYGVVGGRRFIATAPYVARVPPGVPHTFMNAGSTPLNLIAVFPAPELDWTPIGPNPLLEKSVE